MFNYRPRELNYKIKQTNYPNYKIYIRFNRKNDQNLSHLMTKKTDVNHLDYKFKFWKMKIKN
jgi:hypothetical protein